MHIKVSKGGGTCINLPKAFCKELNIKPGDEIICKMKDGKIVLEPQNEVRDYTISRFSDDKLTICGHGIYKDFTADKDFCNLFSLEEPDRFGCRKPIYYKVHIERLPVEEEIKSEKSPF